LEDTGVTAWFPLEPVSEANGTLYLFPETHKGAVLEHASVVGKSVFHTFKENLDMTKAIPVLLPLGGVSFHHKKLIHGAPANSGESRRVAFAQHYKAIQ
jgi:phytanoyl-CoA hydroxylase